MTADPNNYAYKMENPDSAGIQTICKVRGITLNYKNGLSINFNTVRDMVTNGLSINFNTVRDMVTNGNKDEVITVIDENKISRDQKNARIITKEECKDYKIVFDKRVIVDNNNTKPYGY